MELRPLVCLCLLTLSSTTSAEGSGQTPLKVEEATDVILPCFLGTQENIESKRFDWTKAAIKDAPRKEVFFYDAGKHYNNGKQGQSEEFKGRVFHFKDELKHGNASIIIRNTKVADSGNYTCVFPHHQNPNSHVELIVGAAPKPSVTILDETKDWSRLQCDVHGDPEPELEWRDSAGHKIPAGQQKASDRGGRQYFTLNATVTKTDSYHCVATQKTINHQTEAKIYVHIGEPPPINVHEGGGVTLPCSLDTKANIESELFEWRKDGQKEVFMFDGGKHSRNGHGSQSEEFKGRVFHFQDRLKHGDASITITNTKMTDRGNYTCEFPNLQPRQTFHMELVVAIGDGRSGPQSDGSESTPGWIIAVVSVLCTLFVVGVLLAVLKYKGCITLKRNKENQKKQPAEEVKSDLSPDPEASIPLKTQ